MSEKKTNEERQKEVDRQLQLMKAAIGDDDFSDSDSDSDVSEELRERDEGKSAAMESARKFLWDEAEDDADVMLGGPFPTAPAATLTHTESQGSSTGLSHRGSTTGLFRPSIFARGVVDADGDMNINLMDATEARASHSSSSSKKRPPLTNPFQTNKTRPSLSNLFLRGSTPRVPPPSWNDAGARDSEEFMEESDSKRPSYMVCLGWTAMWALTLSLFGIFGYYVYDFVSSLAPARPEAQPIQPTPIPLPTDVQQALVNAGVLTSELLQDPNSPQNQALQWMTEDGLALDDPFLSQRYALAVFYYSTRGPFWDESDGWLSKDGYCQWYGVQCLGTETLIEENNHNGPVFEVNLSSNNLQGNIPFEVSAFQDLFFLDLQDNHLEGTIPNKLGGFKALRMFSIAHNQLYGSIPEHFLTSSPDLHIFNAGHNHFSGVLPTAIGSVTSLREIRLEYNDLDGSIPDSWQALDRLETLHLAGNKLQGSLKGVYDMDRLETLYLHDNALTGELSPDFGRLSHLELLTLNHNKLKGTVPDVFAKTRFLQEMHLHSNEFTGTMPNSVCSLTTQHKLTYLSVDCTETNAAHELGVHCDCCTNCMR